MVVVVALVVVRLNVLFVFVCSLFFLSMLKSIGFGVGVVVVALVVVASAYTPLSPVGFRLYVHLSLVVGFVSV